MTNAKSFWLHEILLTPWTKNIFQGHRWPYSGYFSLDYLKTSLNNYHQIDGYHRYNALLFLMLKVIRRLILLFLFTGENQDSVKLNGFHNVIQLPKRIFRNWTLVSLTVKFISSFPYHIGPTKLKLKINDSVLTLEELSRRFLMPSLIPCKTKLIPPS